jgi:hypothetical protein
LTTDNEAIYLAVDLFQGDESELACRTVKMVTTRKDHQCSEQDHREAHIIPAGQRARHERALVDGDFWGSYYTCTACLDRFIAGKGNPMKLVFDQKGTWKAKDAAEQWCRDNGVSFGSSCDIGPTGLLRGNYRIAKWRNLTLKERSQLDGTMDGDLREGPVTITLRDKAPNV